MERRGRRSFPTYEQGVEGVTIDSIEAGGDLTVGHVMSFRMQMAIPAYAATVCIRALFAS